MLGLNEPVPSTDDVLLPTTTKIAEQPPDTSVPAPQSAKPPSQTQQLEDELELDLENMKIDEDIDTSVRNLVFSLQNELCACYLMVIV